MMPDTASKREESKYRNRGLVLQLLATGECSSRIELSKRMNLSKMAVSNIVNDLIEKEVLIETESDVNEMVGRNPVGLTISEQAPKVVGLLIFRTRVEVVLCSLRLQILRRESIVINNIQQEELIQYIYEAIDMVMAGAEKCIGIGVASIGPVHVQKGMILSPFYFYGIHDVKIVELLEERYGLPVFFDNDNQCGVLAEKMFGDGKAYADILLLGIAEGVGCGIITQNQLLGNKRGFDPEVGHISVDYRGNVCACGNRGCIETYIRTPVMLENMRKATGKFYSYRKFCEIAEDNELVDQIFMDAMNNLAVAIVTVINILNSELVLLGHDACYWKEKYLRELEQRINQYKFGEKELRVKVRHTSFGKDSQLYGAACLVIQSVFEDCLQI